MRKEELLEDTLNSNYSVNYSPLSKDGYCCDYEILEGIAISVSIYMQFTYFYFMVLQYYIKT